MGKKQVPHQRTRGNNTYNAGQGGLKDKLSPFESPLLQEASHGLSKEINESNCGHEKCKGLKHCLYTDEEIKKQSKVKNSQDQHYLTKSVTKEWVLDGTKVVKYFDGENLIEDPVRYEKVFFYVDEWDRELEKKFEHLLEGSVVNKILRTNKFPLLPEEENKLISFSFIQSLRKIYPYNKELANKYLNTFLYDNQNLHSVVDYKFVDLNQSINMPEQGIITMIDFKSNQIVQILPFRPNKVLIMMNKHPFVNINSINIDEHSLKQFSYGYPGMRIVLGNDDDVLNIKKNQDKNLESYKNNEDKIKEILSIEAMVSVVAMNSDSFFIPKSKESYYKEAERMTTQPKLYQYVTLIRTTINYRDKTINKDSVKLLENDLNIVFDEGKKDPVKSLEWAKKILSNLHQIDILKLDDWIKKQVDDFYKNSGLKNPQK